jgi:hypothetical protein
MGRATLARSTPALSLSNGDCACAAHGDLLAGRHSEARQNLNKQGALRRLKGQFRDSVKQSRLGAFLLLFLLLNLFAHLLDATRNEHHAVYVNLRNRSFAFEVSS